MSREVRKVTVDWKHPKLSDTLYLPLFDGSKFQQDVERYEIAERMWSLGMVRDVVNNDWMSRDEAGISETRFESYYGPHPDVRDYMPLWDAETATHFMLYENMTHGTPLSPAFATRDDLAAWCVKNDVMLCSTRGLTFAGWLKLCRGFTAGQLMREKTETVLIRRPDPVLALA